MPIKCFDILGNEKLSSAFNKEVEGKKLTEQEEREIATKIALDFHKDIVKRLNEIKTKTGGKVISINQKEILNKIKSVQEDFDNQEKAEKLKEKEFISKNGKHKIVYDEKGNIKVVDTKTGEEASSYITKKVINEKADSFDYSKGKRIEEEDLEGKQFKDEEELDRHVVENSENPTQIAEVFVMQKPTGKPLSTVEQFIAEFGIGRITSKSWKRFGDRNYTAMSLAKSYLDGKGAKGIDQAALEMSDHYGIEITPDDIVEFMKRFPNGTGSAFKLTENEVAFSAKERFQELTGLPLNSETAAKAINYEFNKLNEAQRILAEQQFKSEKELETAYWREHKATNGFTKESSDTKVEQKEAKVEPPKPPIEDNVVEGVSSIEPPFTLIKRELVKARERVGLGEFDKETVTDEKAIRDAEIAINEWKEKGTYQKEIDRIIEESKKGVISDLNNSVLAQHIADLETTGKKMDRFSKEYDKNRSELKKALEAGDSLRSAAGRILGRDIQVFGREIESVQDVEMQMMEDTDQDVLTDEQKREAEKRFNEFKEVADKEAKLRVEAEAEIERLKAELEIAKAKKAASGTTKKTKGDYQAERKTIVESIKDKWNKASNDGTLTSVPLPYAKQLAAIAPDVAKLLNSYINEFGDITLEKARELLKKDINEAGIEVSDEDVRGLIAGKFKEKKESKSELVTKRQDLVTEEKLLLEIEKLEKGEVPVTEIGKRKRIQKFKELRDRIKELKAAGLAKDIELPSEIDEAQKKFETAIKTQIANNRKEQARIEDKIKNKDYSQDEPKSKILDNPLLKRSNPKLYEEYLQAVEDKYNAKLKLEKDRIDDKIKNRSGLDKIKDWANIAFTTTQSTVAGFDQSMVMVQLLGHTLAHPINTAKFARDSFKDMFSKRFFDRRMATLHNTAIWDVIEKSGLVIYEPRSFKAELRAEQHGGDKNLWNKSFQIKGKNYSIGQAFERSTTGFINNARVSLFLNGVENLQQQGKTFENSPKEYEALARVCNELTGHGKVQKHVQMASELVNKVIWSPKMLASTFNILGLGDLASPVEMAKEVGRSFGADIKESGNTKGFYSSLTPKQRAFMRKELGRALGSAALIIGAGMLTGAIDDFDFDPRSSGFGSITKGDTTINLFGRFASAFRTIVQVVGGEKKTDKGVYQIGEKYGSKKTEDVLIGGFGRGKMTPLAGMTYDYFLNNKKNYYTEERVTPAYIAKNLAVPMSLQGAIKDVIQSDEQLYGVAKTLSKSYGLDVKNKKDYNEVLKNKRENKIEDRKEKIRKTLEKANKKP